MRRIGLPAAAQHRFAAPLRWRRIRLAAARPRRSSPSARRSRCARVQRSQGAHAIALMHCVVASRRSATQRAKATRGHRRCVACTVKAPSAGGLTLTPPPGCVTARRCAAGHAASRPERRLCAAVQHAPRPHRRHRPRAGRLRAVRRLAARPLAAKAGASCRVNPSLSLSAAFFI